MRREYMLRLQINGRSLNRILIDPHYELKHADTINDVLIIELVKLLNGRYFIYEKLNADGWEMYARELYWNDKVYRLVWCLNPEENYLGVINAFRR